MLKKIILFLMVVAGMAVIAAAVQDACCERTVDGEWCQFTNANNCDEGYRTTPVSCEQTSFCKVGCCYNSEEGQCFKSTPRSLCESDPQNTWNPDAACQIEQCSKGCCIIAGETFFVTEAMCKAETSKYKDAEMDFREDVTTEPACVALSRTQEKGCCVNGDSCSFTAREQCETSGAEAAGKDGFYLGTLCSNDALSCDCARQQRTGCLADKDDVYWFDSCGNPENIYDSNKERSYNQGYVLSEEESCSINGHDDPNCGNCEYDQGTLCAEAGDARPKFGDFVCGSLQCDAVYSDDTSPNSGGDKQNGESWCIYDGDVGGGRDLVGSRHFRHLCINGQELVEPCRDFREQLCIQGALGDETPATLKDAFGVKDGYIEAVCRKNNFDQCSSCNNIASGGGECSKFKGGELQECLAKRCCENVNRDCFWLEAGITKAGHGVCVPQVPPGLKFWDEPIKVVESTSRSSPATIAAVLDVTSFQTKEQSTTTPLPATPSSPVPERSTTPLPQLRSDESTTTPLEATTRPASQRDSTPTTRPVGTTSRGNSVCDEGSKSCTVKWKRSGINRLFSREEWECLGNCQCTTHEWIVAGNNYCKALGDCGAYYNILGRATLDGYGNTASAETKFFDGKELQLSEVGDWKALSKLGDDDFKNAKEYGGLLVPVLGVIGTGLVGSYAVEGGKFSPFAGPTTFLSYLFKDAIGKGTFSVGQRAAEAFGAKAAGTSPVIASSGTATVASAVNAFFWVYGIYQAVDIFLTQEKSETYTISCGLWQAPEGGDDCEKCNDDPKNKPCSLYRCKSLGQLCSLVNEGTKDEKCVNINPNDANSPIITPWPDALQPGHTITEITAEGNKGYKLNERVDPFTIVSLGILTDEPSQCKFSRDSRLDFDNMAAFFGDSIYNTEHKIKFNLPGEFANDQALELTNGGLYQLYVRCKDASGNKNNRDYFIRFNIKPGPDLTPPVIEQTSIDNNAFVAYGTKQTEFSVFVSEPSQCKWNLMDIDYSQMENDFSCAAGSGSTGSPFFGLYECSTQLNVENINDAINYYIKCKDQPSKPESQRNVNTDSYLFSLRGSKQLNIENVTPTGRIFAGDFELTVKTGSGAENGKAVCGYSTEDVQRANMIEFFETNSDVHKQPLVLDRGNYNIFIACSDIAGNENRTNVNIIVDVDRQPPVVLQIYTEGTTLHLELDEDAACEIGTETFRLGEGTKIGENSRIHEAALEADKEYNIKCADKFGNIAAFAVVQ